VNEIDFYLEGALRHTPRRSTCTRGPDNLLWDRGRAADPGSRWSADYLAQSPLTGRARETSDSAHLGAVAARSRGDEAFL